MINLPFELFDTDKENDPDFEPARGARLSMALKYADITYKNTLDTFRLPDGKAASLIGWLSALLAISAFQHIPGSPVSPLLIGAFLSLLVTLAFAVKVHSPVFVGGGGIQTPLTIYRYQSSASWDERETTNLTGDAIAEAQTQLMMVKCLDAATQQLDRATVRKLRYLKWAYVFYGIAIALISASYLLPALKW